LDAIKFDKEKPKMDLFPPKALKAIAQGMTHGAKKYNRFNYKLGEGLNWTQPYAACMRHLNAWNDGEDMDEDSGLPHLWLAGCEMVMLIDLVESEIGDDTRFDEYAA